MNRKACLIFFFVCLLAGMGSLGATRPDSVPYMLMRFDNSSGLPQNSVKKIAQDPYGFVWAATEDGLARYDGESIVAFRMADLRLSSKRVINFYVNPQGELSCVTDKDDYIRLINGRPLLDSNLQNRPGNYLVTYAPDNPADTGVSRMAGLPFKHRQWGLHIRELNMYTGRRNFFAWKNNEVSYYHDSVRQFSIPFIPDSSWNFALIGHRLYFLHQSGMVTMFDRKPQTAPLGGDIRKDPLFRTSSNEMTVFWNGYIQGNVIVYFNNRLYLVLAGKDGQLSTRLLFTGFDLPVRQFTCAYYSEEQGKLFLGSPIRGLYVLSAQQFFTRGAHDRDDAYYGQAAVGPEEILTAQGDLIGLSTPPRIIGAVRQMMPSNQYSMVADSLGNVFIKWAEWLYKFEKNSYRLLKKWKLPGSISVVYEGGDGRLWIGVKEKGLATMSLYDETAKPEWFLTIREDVTYMARQEHILYTATDEGTYLINIANKHIDTIPGLNGKYVRSLLVLPGGEVWLTTYGHGFFRYYRNRLTAFPLDQQEYLAIAHCMVADNNGFLWITTNNGLFQASRADLLAYAHDSTLTPYYHHYNRQDGFRTNEFNGGCQPCAVRLESGYVSLPSLNGLVFFRPDSMRPLLPGPHLFIDRIELDKATLPPLETLELPRDFKYLSIFLSSPNMTNGLNLQMRYALVKDGETPLWLPLSQKHISLSTLPHGTYRLLIRKMNGFGRDNFTEKSILLRVLPAWYQTRWFYVACLLGCLACFYLLMKLRVRYTEERNRALKAAVALKTEELQRRTDIQEKIIRSVSHDIQTPLQYQHLLSGKIYEELQEQQAAMAPAAKVMHEHTHRLYYMVNNLLKYLKVEVADRPNRIERFALAPAADETLMIFKGLAAERGTALRNHIPASLELNGDVQLISVILHNLVDNAVKITRNGSIDIDAGEGEEGSVCITIRDTGPGLKPAIQQWINTPGTTREGLHLVNGIGLMIVKELVAMLELEISVTAEKGQGTCFRIRC
ncbi:ATP-binding protein [Chitinophaga sp.]|uniref:sensor histidine kinase n=1 Tax=Chitinophaga sp. TaxID=1869181 RepID=UPI0031CE613E